MCNFLKNKKGQWVGEMAREELRERRREERKRREYKTKILLEEGLDPIEIAKELDVSVSTIKNYIKKCEYVTLEEAKAYFEEKPKEEEKSSSLSKFIFFLFIFFVWLLFMIAYPIPIFVLTVIVGIVWWLISRK